MSAPMYFPERLGSSEPRLLFSGGFFFWWVGFSGTDAGLLSESESSEARPQIAKKI